MTFAESDQWVLAFRVYALTHMLDHLPLTSLLPQSATNEEIPIVAELRQLRIDAARCRTILEGTIAPTIDYDLLADKIAERLRRLTFVITPPTKEP
jgi:hypothetical protein